MNNIARRFVQQDVDKRSAEAEHTLAFLDQQLPELRKQLDRVRAALQHVSAIGRARSI